jgi:hypothetical protein
VLTCRGEPPNGLAEAGTADADAPPDTDTIPRFATVSCFDPSFVERIFFDAPQIGAAKRDTDPARR